MTWCKISFSDFSGGLEKTKTIQFVYTALTDSNILIQSFFLFYTLTDSLAPVQLLIWCIGGEIRAQSSYGSGKLNTFMALFPLSDCTQDRVS